MNRPTEFLVRTVIWPEDPDGEPDYDEKDCPSLKVARSIAARPDKDGYAAIVRRKNLVDVTPAGDPPGLLWDFETEVLEEFP